MNAMPLKLGITKSRGSLPHPVGIPRSFSFSEDSSDPSGKVGKVVSRASKEGTAYTTALGLLRLALATSELLSCSPTVDNYE